jgi:hypothetical protein
MRVTYEDSADFGMALSCVGISAITREKCSRWAARAIDEEEDAPSYLYTMLDLQGLYGRTLQEEIGFEPGAGGMDFNEDDYHYLRQMRFAEVYNLFHISALRPVSFFLPNARSR